MICQLCAEPFMFGDTAFTMKRSELSKHPGTGQTILRPSLHENGSHTLYFHLHCLAEVNMVLIAAEGGRVDG